jgi:membrane-associated phospholipid phosphatase
VIAVAASLTVGVSRIQRGAHHPVDVSLGFALGVATLLVVRAALSRGVADLVASDARLPSQVRRLDLTKEPTP